jgi:hypothetical protein
MPFAKGRLVRFSSSEDSPQRPHRSRVLLLQSKKQPVIRAAQRAVITAEHP